MINLIIKISNESGKVKISSAKRQAPKESEAYEALFERLGLAVQASANKEYGYFEEGSLTPFHQALENFCSDQGSLDLLEAALTESLSACFTEIPQDHYLWIAQCRQADQLPIGLFLVKHDAGYFFDDELALKQAYCIDPAKLKYAAVIDPVQWQKRSNRYITLLTPKSSEVVADGFRQLLGFAVGIDRKADTEQFLQMVQQYSDEVIPSQKREVAPRVFQYCFDQDRQGRSVNIKKLSEYMDEQEPEAFAKYVAANLDTAPTDWHPDRRQVQKQTKFFGKDQNLSISFSSMMFGDDIVYDERTNSLTIRSLPKSLVRQIERYLRKSG